MRQNKIPNRLNRRLNTVCEGPNCWNATKTFHMPKARIEFTPGESMDRWLARYTVPVSQKDIQPGDIFVMRGRFDSFWSDTNTDLVHTAVLVTKAKLFHKRGYTGAYEIVSFRELLDTYGDVSDRHEWRRFVGSKRKAA